MPIYIVENGYGYDDQLVDGVINDDYRIDYMRKHIEEMKKAVEEGAVITLSNTPVAVRMGEVSALDGKIKL